jgi:hypothetical protein
MVLEQAHISAAADPPGIFTALADRARRLPVWALVALSLCSWVAIALWTIPDGFPWPLPAPILTVGSFGVWGVLERVRIERASTALALKFCQIVVVVIGTIAALTAVFAGIGILMGDFVL